MTEFENIFDQANKKNGKDAPPPKEAKPAPEAGEKKSYAEKMREKKLRCYEMIDEGCASIISNPENMQLFLDVQSRCENYSLSNNILIYMQVDGEPPTRMMDFDGWKKAGCSLKKGAESIWILEPNPYTVDGEQRMGYNVKNVFDIRDVVDPPASEFPKKLDFEQNKLLAALVDGCSVPIQKTGADLGNEVAVYDAKNKAILYKQGVDFEKLFPAIAKARAHAEIAKSDVTYRTADHEFQAKCAAYIIVNKYGKDTTDLKIHSVPNKYTTLEPDAVKDELGVIHGTAKGIAKDMRAYLEKSKEQTQEQTNGEPKTTVPPSTKYKPREAR
jgi:hypothetical protein